MSRAANLENSAHPQHAADWAAGGARSTAGHTYAGSAPHGLIDPSIKRSREGVRAVLLTLLVLGLAAAAQIVVYLASGSIALLADLIHNVGDAATANHVHAQCTKRRQTLVRPLPETQKAPRLRGFL